MYIMYTWGWKATGAAVCSMGAGCVAGPVARPAHYRRAAPSGRPPHLCRPAAVLSRTNTPATFQRGRGRSLGLSPRSLSRRQGGCGLLPSLQWRDEFFCVVCEQVQGPGQFPITSSIVVAFEAGGGVDGAVGAFRCCNANTALKKRTLENQDVILPLVKLFSKAWTTILIWRGTNTVFTL